MQLGGLDGAGAFRLPPYEVSTVGANLTTQQNPSDPAPLSAEVGRQQARRNGMALKYRGTPTPDECMRMCPLLLHVAALALQELGFSWQEALRVAPKATGINFFLADDTASVGYTWHTDCGDLACGEQDFQPEATHAALYGIRTCVVQLGAMDQTGMCMLGFHHHTYGGRGAAVWFHGSAPHRSMLFREGGSILAQLPVWKVSLFYRHQDLIPEAPSE